MKDEIIYSKKLKKATSFYRRQGYKIQETLNKRVWDFICTGKHDRLYIQIFTTAERLARIENIILDLGEYAEVVIYSLPLLKSDLPSNRIIYPHFK